MKAIVVVRLKEDFTDAPGRAVADRLRASGFPEVRQVRVGKLIEITLDSGDRENAVQRVEEMCRAVLANSNIEEAETLSLD